MDKGLRDWNLYALGTSFPPSLCWRCSKSQGFYQSPCPHCGAINPNYDLDGALEQQDSAAQREVSK